MIYLCVKCIIIIDVGAPVNSTITIVFIIIVIIILYVHISNVIGYRSNYLTIG